MAVAVAGSGYAYATTTTSNETYTGCLSKGVIVGVAIGEEPQAACKKDETEISWSQTGPQGDAGAPGPQGPAGAQGDTGATGDTGAPGPAGPDGPAGPTGPAGATGETGAPGARGQAGPQGETGATGGTEPVDLAGLQGSNCDFPDGDPGLLAVTVATSGAVSMVCKPVIEITMTVSGGRAMSEVSITTPDDTHRFPDFAGTRSIRLPAGTTFRAGFRSGSPETGGGAPFTYVCGPHDSNQEPALPYRSTDGGTWYEATTCFEMSQSYAISAKFTG